MKIFLTKILNVAAVLALAAAPLNAGLLQYTRDDSGRLTAATYANGNSHTFSYDSNGNLLKRAALLAGTANPDSDGDGLDDAWEQLYFGDLSRDGNGDADGDGMNDRAEFLAGSNPLDGASVLRLLPNPTRVGSTVTVQFQSVAGKKYHLQYKDTLNQAAWTDVGSDIVARAATTSATDNSASVLARFYRVTLVP